MNVRARVDGSYKKIHTHTHTHTHQKCTSHPLGLELQMVVTQHVDAGNRTWFFGRIASDPN